MTPQDQEDHRLAALAAGFKVEFRDELDSFVRWHQSKSHEVGFWGSWIPLSYSSDSFDLMVACEIAFKSGGRSSVAAGYWVIANKIQKICEHVVYVSGDVTTKDQSAKEAIFRCAVEIGRAKESAP